MMFEWLFKKKPSGLKPSAPSSSTVPKEWAFYSGFNQASTPDTIIASSDVARVVTAMGMFHDSPPNPATIDMEYAKDVEGTYLLFGGVDYEGEEHIGVFHTLGAAIAKFASVYKKENYDWGTIYTMGKTKLRKYLTWEGKHNAALNRWEYGWRKAGK